LEAVSLCLAVKGDAGAKGERKWGNNGSRSVGKMERETGGKTAMVERARSFLLFGFLWPKVGWRWL
jgi:hypothetical protein